MRPKVQDFPELAIAIDNACDAEDAVALDALDFRCQAMLDEVEPGPSSDAARSRLWYYRSNVQSGLQTARDPRSWHWRQPHRERQILYLRRARAEPDYVSLPTVVRSQIATNLAQNIYALGRVADGLWLYDQALQDQPRFAMALGGRGLVRLELGGLFDDPIRQSLAVQHGLEDLDAAGKRSAIWDSDYPAAQAEFARKQQLFGAWLTKIGGPPKVPTRPLDRTKTERRYRSWAIEEGLFLDPLSLISRHLTWATDHLYLPPHAANGLDEPPFFYAWFNQLKQEYAAARMLMFEAIDRPGPHFADRELGLVDTRDMAAFGLDLEKMRMAFRSAYSLLDKIAGLLNAWFELGMKPARVDFRNVWHVAGKSGIRPEFDGRENIPLRGLYWLALDIVGSKPTDPDSISPAAADLHEARNAMEHRALVLTDAERPDPLPWIEVRNVDAFRSSSLDMLRLTRSAMIQLALALRVDVRAKGDRDLDGIVWQIELGPYRRFDGRP